MPSRQPTPLHDLDDDTHLAANMRRKVAEPEPIGYSLPAILGLACRQESRIEDLEMLAMEQLMCKPEPEPEPTLTEYPGGLEVE